MVTEDQIDMLKQFGSIRNCELIILTSYSFDPLFFDHIALRQLRKGNPYAKIIVLVDSNHFDIEDCTELTGVDYEIITIPSVFHPKMFIFCGSKILTSIIGSHNLTLAGFTHNLETTCKLENHEVALECLDCIQDLLSLFLDSRNQTLLDIEQQKRKIEPENDKDVFFLNNLKATILDQAISIVQGQGFDVKEVIVISPFFSHVDELVKEIRAKIRPVSIKLCIQKE